MSILFRFLRLTQNSLAHFAIISLLLQQFIFVSSAFADLPINPDGTTNTQVTKTASGVDQINIAAPNANGLSHNKFTDYNVNTGGQIINNFSGKNPSEVVAGSGATAITSTTIGGLVTANANLVSSGSAKTILNEVTSTNISRLLGYTEIAGTRADLILANPNGIACAGCGFINTAKLLMVGGSSNFDSSGNLGFNLKEQANPNLYVPLITIDGLGLDVTRTSATEIIASSVKLLSSIYGSDSTSVTIKTGEGRYGYDSKAIMGDNVKNNTDAVFAIDASNLAKIQAGQVFLIATKNGVGVNMAAEILASQSVNIDANGDVYYDKITAGDNIDLKSTNNIQSINSASKISAPNLTIQADEFRNLGEALANNLTIKDNNKLTNFGSIQALNLNLANITNINNSGLIYGQNSLNISGVNLTNNSTGEISSLQSYTIALTGLLTNRGLVTSDKDLNIAANQLDNSAEISAENNLNLRIADSSINSNKLVAGKALSFTGNSLNNSGRIQSTDDASLNFTSLLNQKGSLIYSKNNLNLTLSTSLRNLGEISAIKNLTISGNSIISNSGKILANDDLNISARSLRSGANGMISLLDGISLAFDDPSFGSNSDALISSHNKSLNLSLTEYLDNFGELNSKTDLNISGRNFANFGKILSGNNLNLANSYLYNSGNLQSANDTTIETPYLYNAGIIKSFSNSNINAGELNNQTGALIFSAHDLTITANIGGLNNDGIISSQNNFTLNAFGVNNSGTFYAANEFNIVSSGDLNNAGEISSDGNLTINALNFNNLDSGLIFSDQNLTLHSVIDFTNFGTISSTNNFTLSAVNLNNSGIIKSIGLTPLESPNAL